MIHKKKLTLLAVGFFSLLLIAGVIFHFVFPIKSFMAIPLDYASGICSPEEPPTKATFHYVLGNTSNEYYDIKRDLDNNTGKYSLMPDSPQIEVLSCQKIKYELYL